MTGGMEVSARMLVRARVAASDVTTGQAQPQMCPRALTQLFALLAFAWRERLRVDGGLCVGSEVFACVGDRWGVGTVPA
jgi:hypothetical protein